MGPTVMAARLPSAIFGALAIPALYGLARSLYGRAVGISAALILAGMGVHLHFSRLGMNNIVDPTFLVAALWAARRERWALAGILLGAAQLFYPAARLVPVIVLAALIFWRAGWRAAAITGAGMLIAAWPATWHLVAHGLPLTTRLADVGLAGPVDVWAQVWRATFAYVQVPDTLSDASAAFYGGTAPLVGYAAAVPFLLGLGAIRFRRGRLLILWVGAAALFGGMLLRDPPAYSRYVIALPAAAMLIALGLRALPGIGARWGIVLCAAVMALEIVLYFGGHLRIMDRFGPKTAQLNAIAGAVRDAEPGGACLWRDPDADDPAHSSIVSYLAAGVPIPACPIRDALLYLAVPARADALSIFEDEAGEWVIYTDVRGQIVLTGFRPEFTK
jgi:4-amino-4-deoxy-L-arabinose transferase-like glycosyltransferase